MLTRWPSGEGDGLLIHCALHAWVRIPSSSVSPTVVRVSECEQLNACPQVCLCFEVRVA